MVLLTGREAGVVFWGGMKKLLGPKGTISQNLDQIASVAEGIHMQTDGRTHMIGPYCFPYFRICKKQKRTVKVHILLQPVKSPVKD